MDKLQKTFRVFLDPPHHVAAFDMGQDTCPEPQQMGKALSADIHHIGDFQMCPQIVQDAVPALVEKIQPCIEKKAEQESFHLPDIENLVHNFTYAERKHGACDGAENYGAK